MEVRIQHFFDEHTSTLTYVADDGKHAVLFDPVHDFDPNSARTRWHQANAVAAYLEREGLTLEYVIDTHAHADHLTAMPFFRRRFSARTVTGKRIGEVQKRFRDIYNLGREFPVNGEQFDLLLDEGEELVAGSLRIRALHTPGHTPAHMSWQVGNHVFLGDTLFMPDYGTARCDFPGGSPEQLYDSIRRIYEMPEDTLLYVCHDYRPGGRPLRYVTTVEEQKTTNIQLDVSTKKEEFVRFRRERDATLDAPKLILQSLQVNIRAGTLPPAEDNGVHYLKIPVDRL